MPLYLFIRFIKYLGRDNTDFQIALGIAVGMLLGMIPILTLHWFLIFGALLIVRMNFLSAFISFQFFAIASWTLSSLLERLGFWVLTSQSGLLPFWARAYHAPILPFTAFNHSNVMGATVLGFILFVPILLISQILVARFRETTHTFWLSTRLQRAYAHYRRFTH
jgi:uncharacterized protein (TIGR03546 family)